MAYASTGPMQDNPQVRSLKMNQLMQVFADKQGYMELPSAPITSGGQKLPSGESLLARLMPRVGQIRGSQIPNRATPQNPNLAGAKGQIAQRKLTPTAGRAGTPMITGMNNTSQAGINPMAQAGINPIGQRGSVGQSNPLQAMAILAMMQQRQNQGRLA